ncbi:MAG: TIGR02597 family protein [Planctomycetes bacterium]|nr:TIGR02597 family protein [Planctomycetota bacterium]
MMLLALSVASVQAGGVQGYNAITIPPGTDVRVTVPFNQKVEGTFTVSSKSGNVITVGGGLTSGAFNGSKFYVRFVDGTGEGLWTTITSNTATTLTIEDANVLAQVSNGNTFRIYKHHTIRSIFPEGFLGISFLNNSTQILVYSNSFPLSKNRSASATSLHVNGNWVGSANNNTILKPETQFIVRNTSGQQLKLFTFGTVPDYTVSMLIGPNGDMNIGTGYPVAVVLKNAGLSGSQRQVLFYNNASTGTNKSASKTALSVGANWVGAGVTGNELFNPSESFTFRLPSSEAGTKVSITKPY